MGRRFLTSEVPLYAPSPRRPNGATLYRGGKAFSLLGYLQNRFEVCCVERIVIELMTSDRKLKASREGSKSPRRPNGASLYRGKGLSLVGGRGTSPIRNSAPLGPCSRPMYLTLPRTYSSAHFMSTIMSTTRVSREQEEENTHVPKGVLCSCE